MKREIFRLVPVWKPMIWGNEKWVASAHQHGDCFIAGGSLDGWRLSQVWQEKRALFGNMEGQVFPLMVKIINADDDLSIQVHPDDAYAEKYENGSLGKTECWYVLNTSQQVNLAVGHNAVNHKQLIEMITENRWKELLREIPARKGDFIQMEPGTLHAVRGGIKLLEIQENSDITYRIYDYERLIDGRPRELHLQKGLDVIRVPALPPQASMIPINTENIPGKRNLLISCNYYDIWRLDVAFSAEFMQNDPFLLVYVLEGEGMMDQEPLCEEDCFILPYKYGKVMITGNLSLILVSRHV